MVFRDQLALSFLLLIPQACENIPSNEVGDEKPTWQIEYHSKRNKTANSVRIPVSIPVDEAMVKSPRTAKPKYRPLSNSIRETPIPTMAQTQSKAKTVAIPDQITTLVPGQEGISLPVKVAAQGTEVDYEYPKAFPALAPGIRHNAKGSIQYLDIDQGLSSSSINAILEDRRGHLWFGTNGGGLCRYDGTTFSHLTIDSGLSSKYIACLLEDKWGRLWIGTKGEGVNVYDGHTLIHFGKEAGLNGAYVESMVEDNDGNIWFGMRRGGGLSRYDGTGFVHYTEREGLISDEIRCLYLDSLGNLWIGTGKGACKFDGLGFSHFTIKEGLSSNRVEAIYEDEHRNIWFGSIGGGLCRFDGTAFTHYGTEQGLPSDDVLTIAGDVKGEFWLGTRGGGASHYRAGQFTGYSVEDGLSSNHVTFIKQDSRGIHWFATWGGGVSKINPCRFAYLGKDDGLDNDHVLAVLEDSQNNLWIGTHRGVSRFDGKSFRHFRPEEGLAPHPILSTLPVLSILEDSRGDLWFGTDLAGVNRFNGKGFMHYGKEEGLSHAAILCMAEDNDGYIWFGTRDGLTRYDPSSNHQGSFSHFLTDQGLWVGSMLEDKMGNLWFGTTNGAYVYDGQSFRLYTRQQGLASHGVSCMLEDSEGNIWFGSDNGVSQFDGRDFINYNRNDGLPHNNIRSIIEDQERNIWISTEGGIAALMPVSEAPKPTSGWEAKHYRCFTFDKGDGLKCLDFALNSACLDQKNRIWWGCSSGLTMLDLGSFAFPTHDLQIGLASIEISQKHVDYRWMKHEKYRGVLPFGDLLKKTFEEVEPFYNYPNSWSVPHNIDHLIFHLTSTNLVAPHQTKYSFFLEGADRGWSHPSTSNTTEYRNLDPGSYTFRAKAVGSAKKWSDPMAYSFSIYPPWWQTWWAYFVYAVLLISLVLFIRRYELKRQNLAHQLDLENIRSNKLEEINAIKARFFANVSHEFRTPLTLMLGPVKELIASYPKSNLSYLQLIQGASHRLLNLINQLLALTKVDARKMKLRASSLDFIPFTREIFALFISMAEYRNIQYTYHSNTETQCGYFDPELFEQILVNLLDNAFKFTPNGGEVHLAVESREQVLLVSVSDSGPGIHPNHLPHIFDRFFQIEEAEVGTGIGTGIGLALVRELVQLHHGEVAVESNVGRGSRFIIEMPLGKNHLKDEELLEESRSYSSAEVTMLGALNQKGTKFHEVNGANKELPLVLVVEDNADMRTYIRQIIGGRFRIVDAVNGEQAMIFARKYIPDFILSDVMMPVMSGLTLCHKLKTDALTSHIPVLLLTARADIENRIEGLKLGADAYLAKPFDKQELLVRMEKLIELRRQLQVHYQNLVHLDANEYAGVEMQHKFIQQLRQHVEENLGNHKFEIPQLCRLMQMSRAQLYRKVKALTGKSVGHFIRTHRLRKAMILLKTSQLNISEIAYEVGFQDPAYFSRTFSEEYGMSPSKMR